ncbi:MAG: acyl-CoA dehydrogenase [Robiginitomaculum sp.]|nr:MAG: acyl-CoA dehydrogenase [Robiginitomaculum sp.]
MSLSQFQYHRISDETEELRHDVRAFLEKELANFPPVSRADSWMGHSFEFSEKLGEQGWVGMSLPKTYGGAEMELFARYVVSEELLAAGAPVAAHWMGDRQSGPLILSYGTDAQKEKYLPDICKGKGYFCIGMSEPNSGSDLASVATRARLNDEGGWTLNGCKLWTTNAHKSDYMIALVRTQDKTEHRHAGLSQIIIDLKLDGVTIRPIKDMSGDAHFNEVVFEDVKLSPEALIGTEGNGWQQVMAELAFERSGPERYLSSMALVYAMIHEIGDTPDALQQKEIGVLAARLFTLRNMSMSVTAELVKGNPAAWAATIVKDLGTSLEQETPLLAQSIIPTLPSVEGGSDYARILAKYLQTVPSFSLRGGTREILRGIIAGGLGGR